MNAKFKKTVFLGVVLLFSGIFIFGNNICKYYPQKLLIQTTTTESAQNEITISNEVLPESSSTTTSFQGADLTINSISISKNPCKINESEKITVNVKEVGGATIYNRIIQYYLSKDRIITSNDYYIGYDYVTLSAYDEYPEDITFVPDDINGIEDRDYYVGVLIPDENQYFYNPNPLTITSSANLTVTSIGWDKNPIHLNESGKIDAWFDEVGGANVSNRKIEYYLSVDESITTTDFYVGCDYVNVSANSNTSESITYTPDDIDGIYPGDYYIGIIIPSENDKYKTTTKCYEILPALESNLELTTISFSNNPTYLNDELTITSGINEVGGASVNNREIKYYLSLDENISASNDYYVGNSYISIDAKSSTTDYITIIPGDLGLNPGDYYVGVIIPDENNEVWGTDAATLSIIISPTNNIIRYSPPFIGAMKSHSEVESVAIWGRRVASAPSDYTAESGKIIHRSLVAAKFAGGTVWTVEDKISIPINVSQTGFYKVTFKGKVDGYIAGGSYGELNYWVSALALCGNVYNKGGEVYYLYDNLDKESPSILGYILESASLRLLSVLFPTGWVSGIITTIDFLNSISDIASQLKDVDIYNNEDFGSEEISFFANLQEEKTYTANFSVWSVQGIGASAGIGTGLIQLNTELSELVIEEYSTETMPIPSIPTLSFPENTSENVTTSPTMIWKNSTNASTYRLQISKYSNFSSLIADEDGINNIFHNINNLDYSTKYYWRISASNQSGSSSFSDIWSFTTIPSIPEKPTLISPSNSSVNISISPIFQWQEVQSAKSYRLQLSKNSDFTILEADMSNITDNSYQIQNLNNNTIYYWRISATNEGGTGPYSDIWSLETLSQISQKPSTPTLLTPINRASNVSTSPILSWNESSNTSFYHFVISLDQEFNLIVCDYNNVSSNSIHLDSLSENTQYYWKVCATNNYGTSEWSSIWSFETGNNMPDGIVASYKFNNNANDNSEYLNHGTVYGANCIMDRFGNNNSAYYFDGVDDYIEIADNPSLQLEQFTICIWINIDIDDPIFETNPRIFFINKGGLGSETTGKNTNYIISYQDSCILLGFEENRSGADFNNTIPLSTLNDGWNYLTFTYNGSKLKSYLNGSIRDSLFTNGAIPEPNTLPLRIGLNSTPYAYEDMFFKGSIDDILIFNCALSESAILDLYHSENWDMDTTKINEVVVDVEFCLKQNYPNPFNPNTKFDFNLLNPNSVQLLILDLRGNIIKKWFFPNQQPGWHSVIWDGTDMHGNVVSTGVYIYCLKAGNFIDSKKMVFMK